MVRINLALVHTSWLSRAFLASSSSYLLQLYLPRKYMLYNLCQCNFLCVWTSIYILYIYTHTYDLSADIIDSPFHQHCPGFNSKTWSCIILHVPLHNILNEVINISCVYYFEILYTFQFCLNTENGDRIHVSTLHRELRPLVCGVSQKSLLLYPTKCKTLLLWIIANHF